MTLGEAVRSILPDPKPFVASTRLEDHEEPHIEIPEVRPSPAIPKVEPQIPQNLPGTIPSIALKVEPQAQPMPVVEPKIVPVARPTIAQIKSYSADPYREPIDEPPTA